MYKLYGDGVHDDYPAIQELIDSGKKEIFLPLPENFYLISKSLELPSNFKLILPRFAVIRLADNANCVMVKNKTVTRENYTLNNSIMDFCEIYTDDYRCENIAIEGGIWDFNNKNQIPNPIQTLHAPNGYTGFGMLFYNVKGLTIHSLTLKDPVNFAVTLDTVSYFTVDDIQFDYNYGNPTATNMDGIHLNGNCHYGRITNLKGACYDDVVAINADEGSNGPISNIQVDGIFSEDSHSAVRLLTVTQPVENINITNVFGSYYQYCIGLTKYYPGETTGYFDNITLSNIYASKAERYAIYQKGNSPAYPFIFIQDETVTKNLYIKNLHRKEKINTVETVFVGKTAKMNNLVMENVTCDNLTDSPFIPFVIKGAVNNLSCNNILIDGNAFSVEKE